MLLIALLVASLVGQVFSCTNLLINQFASTDGSNIIAYNADAANFYTTIYHYPAQQDVANGTMRKIWTWDYGTYLGEIPEATETYNVVGNVNEYGLVITESTFGGLAELICNFRTGLIDYGSLIYITLQRSKTAREAIETMTSLVQQYGYASTGESFSIADQSELWILELIGKGKYATGAVWVARKVPDGYVSGHANQARITTFPLDDTENTLYSADVISFARELGLYDGADADFSFSDVYDPVTFDGARMCEARVWSFFSAVMGEEWSDQYLDYALGYNLENRMPLWVRPTEKLSPQDVMQSMRNHYEGTELDNSGKSFPDVGAGSFYSPYRNRPGSWSTESNPDKKFFNERTIGQGPTGWSIVCQSRPNVPRQIAALLWFGIDDSTTSVHFPLYGSVTRIPAGWAGKGPQDGVTPPMMTFSLDSAFYVFNLVANWAYSRWDAIYADVYAKILEKESLYFEMAAKADATAVNMINEENNEAAAVAYLTDFSVDIGDTLLKDWFTFFGELFVKYRDGYVTTAAPHNPVCGCQSNSLRYADEWYDRIVDENGARYTVPATADVTTSTTTAAAAETKGRKFHNKPTIPKSELRAMQ